MPKDWQPRLIQLLAIPGLLLAFYLLLYHNGVLTISCGTGGWEDCGQVSGPGAPYSAIGPVPVALIGVLGYALIFLLVWLKDWLTWIDDYLPELMAGATGLAFLFSLGLTGLEVFVIRTLCRYCLISAALVTVMFGLAISFLVKREVHSPPDQETGEDYGIQRTTRSA